MKTDSVRMHSPNFGMMYIKQTPTATEAVIDSIKRSPAGRKFGRLYNADVSLQFFSSASKPGKTNYGLLIENIKPCHPLSMFLGIFRRKGDCRYINYNSGRHTVDDFIHVLRRLDKNTFIKLYNNY